MSNGDDVLDSWEEIDESNINKSLKILKATSLCKTTAPNITTTTTATQGNSVSNIKSIETTKLETMKLLQRQSNGNSSFNTSKEENTESALDTMNDTLKPVLMMLHRPRDEYQSANYMTPTTNQTVKILRRPSQISDGKSNNGMNRPKQPVKTLQQREQEYAEARLRILGAAKNPEDDVTEEDKAKLEGASLTTTINNTNVKTAKIMPEKQTMPPAVVNDDSGYRNYNMPQKSKMQNYFYPPPATSNAVFHARPMGMIPTLPPQNLMHNPTNYAHLNVMMHANQPPIPQTPWLNNVPPSTSQQSNHFYLQHNDNKIQHQQQQQQQQKMQNAYQVQNESILRLPRGPDGSVGFQMRR